MGTFFDLRGKTSILGREEKKEDETKTDLVLGCVLGYFLSHARTASAPITLTCRLLSIDRKPSNGSRIPVEGSI